MSYSFNLFLLDVHLYNNVNTLRHCCYFCSWVSSNIFSIHDHRISYIHYWIFPYTLSFSLIMVIFISINSVSFWINNHFHFIGIYQYVCSYEILSICNFHVHCLIIFLWFIIFNPPLKYSKAKWVSFDYFQSMFSPTNLYNSPDQHWGILSTRTLLTS